MLLQLKLGAKELNAQEQPFQFLEETPQGPLTCTLAVSTSSQEPISLADCSSASDWYLFPNVDVSKCLVTCTLYSNGQLFARASLLRADYQNYHGCVSRPLFDVSLNIIGSVSLSYHVITSFPTSSSVTSVAPTPASYFTSLPSSLRVGHRGSGNSMKSIDNFRAMFQENTILSFLKAAEQVDFIELDVQLTSDHVPIIIHDMYVVDSPSRDSYSPVYSMTLDKLNRATTHLLNSHAQMDSAVVAPKSSTNEPFVRPKSMNNLAAMVITDSPEARPLTIKDPRNNARLEPRMSIRDVIPTLQRVLEKLPLKCGLNIEVKYPDDLFLRENPTFSFPERNLFVDIILDVCYKYAKTRKIIFSSFDPDVCSCLKVKQNTWPVLYLTTASTEERTDSRMYSLEDAMDWCEKAGLDGIVSESSTLVSDPESITRVLSKGLILFSYGYLNNNVADILIQAEKKIHGVISDSLKNLVKAIPMKPISPSRTVQKRLDFNTELVN
ncbi:hypothetical protein RCL1_004610 [Eukaryota sp. TZLM3-RCL]